MALPIPIDYAPMDARLIAKLPAGEEWQYEPKWDGFRCLVFRDGADVQLQSKSGQSLSRYFPELVEAIGKIAAKRFVIDGEIVIPVGSGLSFDALLQRIHPATSRIRKLSVETPATFIAFDMLVDSDGRSLADKPLSFRRRSLEKFAVKAFNKAARMALSPATDEFAVAKKWFAGVGGALDGVIAKRLDMAYQSGNRDGMVKVKQMRTADCVIGGFRYASSGKVLGSLLLGLYGTDGLLHHVGFCSAFKSSEKTALTRKLQKLIQSPGFTGKAPGGPSRWSTERSAEWEPLAPKLVVEVQYDHFTSGRFRHGTKLLRWRPDKAPLQCKMNQVEQEESAMPIRLAT